VMNNVVVYNVSMGLQIAGYDTVSGTKVYNNVFAWNGKVGIELWMSLSNVELKNNITYKNGRAGIEAYYATGGGVVIDHNGSYGHSDGDIRLSSTGSGNSFSYTLGTNYIGDPLFVSTTNFKLQAVSPLIDKALANSLVTVDYDGVSRPQGAAPDVGAYELATAAAVAAPAAPTNVRVTSQ
jgi:hypothetical protein